MKFVILTTLCLIIPGIFFGQDLKWVYTTGGASADIGRSIAMDNQQLIYDLTNFRSTVSLPGQPAFISRGAEDILLRKSTSFGIPMWFKQIGSKGQDLAFDVAVESSGNIFVSGTFEDSLFLDNQFLTFATPGKSNAFLLKLNMDGNLLWVRKFESDIMVAPVKIAPNTNGEILVAGNFEGSVTLFPGLNLSSEGGSDIFLLRMLSNTAAPVFAGQMGGPGIDQCNDLYLDKTNQIYLAGQFTQTADFDPSNNMLNLFSAGSSDAFMVKLSPTGILRFARSLGGSGFDSGIGIATDTSGNVLLTGSFSNSIQLPEIFTSLQSAGETDVFYAKAADNGAFLWINRFGGPKSEEGRHITASQSGIIYIGGIYRDKVDFNPSPVFNNSNESLGLTDVFISVFNQDGTYNEHYVMGGIASEQLNGLVLKKNGEVITCGAFGATVDFDPGSSEANIFSNGGLDGFLWNVFVCVNPYIKSVYIEKPQLCPFQNVLIRIEEGYLNGASQWSWQRGSCNGITFASGSFLNIPVFENTSFFLKGSGGCVSEDSCRQIDITIFRDSIIMQEVSLCQGDSIRVGDNVYKISGSYVDYLTSVAGCDSTVFTEISVYPKYILNQSFEICSGEFVTVGDSTYYFSGTYTNHFNTAFGCDSTVITTLQVLPSQVTNLQETICEGSSVTIGGQTYSTAGTFIQVSENAFGCEDLLIITINVIERDYFQTIAVCQGETIQVGISVYNTSGVYTDSLLTVSGCDSIVMTQLQVHPVFNATQTFILCSGETVMVGSSTYAVSGIYTDTLQTVNGCDSILVSDVQIGSPIPVITDSVLICQGESIIVGNNTYTLQGVYIDSLLTPLGCDSVVITNLTVIPAGSDISANICQGDAFDFYGNQLTLSGSYVYILTNVLGCDSTITLNLRVNPTYSETNTYTLCNGQSVTVGANTYSSEGVFRDTLSTILGCDSIITTQITFRVIRSELKFDICKGSFITVNGVLYNKGGLYADTILTADGCDSILQIDIRELPVWQIDISREICFGDSASVGNQVFKNAGKYSITLQTISGCDSVVNLDLKVINFVPFFQLVKDTLKTVNIPGASYQWYVCTTNGLVPLLGANQAVLPLIKSDRYALGITFQNCSFISPCVDIILSSDQSILKDTLLNIYPNPVSHFLNIDVSESGLYKIWSLNGILLHSGGLISGKNQIDLLHIPDGFVLVETIHGAKSRFKSLVILH
jgi:hypothetical protein